MFLLTFFVFERGGDTSSLIPNRYAENGHRISTGDPPAGSFLYATVSALVPIPGCKGHIHTHSPLGNYPANRREDVMISAPTIHHPTYRTRFMRDALHLTRTWARRMHKRLSVVDLDELYSVGLLTLRDAVEKFDPSRASFKPYLRQRLTWAMTSAARRHNRRYNPNRGLPCGVSTRFWHDRARPVRVTPAGDDQVMPSLLEFRTTRRPGTLTCAGDLSETALHSGDGPERLLLRREVEHALRQSIKQLPQRERTILALHYFGGERFAAIAKLLGMRRARVCQLHREGLTRCRDILHKAGFDLRLLVSS